MGAVRRRLQLLTHHLHHRTRSERLAHNALELQTHDEGLLAEDAKTAALLSRLTPAWIELRNALGELTARADKGWLGSRMSVEMLRLRWAKTE